MKITILKKVLLSFYILVGLNPSGIALGDHNFKNTTCEGNQKTGICNLRKQSDEKADLLSIEKTKHFNRPNVLLIGIETLRSDHVSCLGYHKQTTPTLDMLAKEGVAFSRAIATSSWTLPTCMSVFTSLYPGVHETTSYSKRLSKGKTTLAQILKENGYKTVAFVSNPNLDNRYGFSKGFDLYDDYSVQFNCRLNLFENNEQNIQNIRETMTSEVLNQAVINWLQNNYNQPFFMFVFYFDPHYDYIPPPPFDTVFDPNYEGSIDGRGIDGKVRKSIRPPQRDLDHIIALYDGEILYTNRYISRLLEKLREHKILDDTLIVVFGDHGDEFYEHGSTAHRHSLYNELIQVPLILRWPGKIPQNRQIDAMVSQVDIMPTVLNYLNIEYNGFMQGVSLRTLIEGQKNKLHNVVYAEVTLSTEPGFSAIMDGDKKFILNRDTSQKEFFDLNNDPREQFNIYKKQLSAGAPPLERRLMRWLANNNKIVNRLSGNQDTPKVELDEDLLEQLRSLGYVQ